MKITPILLTDFYKWAHMSQYDPKICRLVSYGTPRGCRLPEKNYVINFGVQAFCKEYLIEKFNKDFFQVPYSAIKNQVTELLTNTLPGVDVDETVKRIMSLHELGYLPLSIRTLPEGGKVDLKCPNIELVTTNENYHWISGYIESLLSSYIWKPMIDATVGHWYRETANKYFEKTADDWQIKARSAMSEFGFRGADSPESGIHSGAAWLLSFDKTATCAAIPWVNEMYNMDYSNVVGKGLISTEHSVMCSSTALNIERIESETIDVTKYYKQYYNKLGINKLGYLNMISEFWEMHENDDIEPFDWVIPRNIWNGTEWFRIDDDIYQRKKGKFFHKDEESIQKEAELRYVKKLLTDIYPNSSFSMVSDSYDYWRMVTKILPTLKNDIMNHNGTLFVRGDSGDPVKIVAGYIILDSLLEKYTELTDYKFYSTQDDPNVLLMNIINKKLIKDISNIKDLIKKDYVVFEYGNTLYQVNLTSDEDKFNLLLTSIEYLPLHVLGGTVENLWITFGGTVNSKGYKVLDSHVRAIYGDSITQQRQEEIYRILELKGFSVENVALGAGSFSFHCYQDEDGKLYPYTRDTYNFAQKATYGEYESHYVGSSADGSGSLQHYVKVNPLMIYKNPKTDNANFKKSMKGCCAVYRTETDVNRNFKYYLQQDELTLQEREMDTYNEFVEIFRDGVMTHEWTFSEIRNLLNNDKF